MANTLKFGNGQWATKVGSTLAYNDENGNFKPLPFNFTRSTGATRVNKEGLIEVVTNNKPRIDFLNDSNGALLLEPQRMNLVQYSEDFSNAYWSKTRIQTPYIADVVSPTGELNAYTLEISSGEVNGGGIFRAISVSGTNSISIFAKKKNTKYLIIGDENFNNDGVWFDLENGLVATEYGLANGSIENYGNGWYKCIMTYTKTSSLSKFIYFSNIDGTSNNGVVGGDSVYIWGAQVEQGSYATSYIPTQGSAVTRTLESSNISNLDDFVLPNTSWTAVGEFIKGQDTDSALYIVFAYYLASSNLFRIRDYTSYVRYTVFEPSELHFTSGTPLGSTVKWAFRAKADGSYSVYVGGVSIGETSGTFRALDLYNMVGNAKTDTKGLKLYNTALTDAELIALTTI
jgi:hypothetical protein